MNYKQKIFADLNALLDKYPGARVSDVLWVLEATAESLWRALPPPKKGRKAIERQQRYRAV